jgi:hypothetical protein
MELLRPMSTGELLDRSFFIYKNDFLVFCGITAIPSLANMLFSLARIYMGPSSFIVKSLIALLGAVISVIVLSIAQSGTITAVSNAHLGRPISIGFSYAAAKECWLEVVGASIFFLMWSLTIPIIVIERSGVGAAMSRSRELTQGSRWRILGIMCVVYIISLIVAALIEFPALYFIGLSGLARPAEIPSWKAALNAFLGFISSTLVMPVGIIATSLIYYDQRVRKEGFDLQAMLDSIKSSPESAQSGMN